jgi:hypothetical protein
LATGFEAWEPQGALFGHGLLLAVVDLQRTGSRAQYSAEFNTETLRLTAQRLPLGSTPLWWGVRLAGEGYFAGLLPDYWREGRSEPERGFTASYVAAEPVLGADFGGQHFVELGLGVRRWFFGRTGDTADALVLPTVGWVAEPRLRYTWWAIRPDPSTWQRHRLFRRVQGIALGAEAGLDLRDSTEPWGARAPAFAPGDQRNDPTATIVRLRAWGEAGYALLYRWRLQARTDAAWGDGEDDLTRSRIGGMNPYVTPVAGAPWAAWLSERYVSGRLSSHIRVGDDQEIGFAGDVVYLADASRTGSSDAAARWGAQAFADLRTERWQLDLRLGVGPGGAGSGITATGYLGLGYGW